VTRWRDFVEAEPEFAARVRARFETGKHCRLATVRRDGSPRISGSEVEFADDGPWLGMMPGSLKALDLQRDPRLALHCPTEDPPEGDPSSWGGDAKISGRAVESFREGTEGHRFGIHIEEVVLTRVGTPADHLVIEAWHPGRGLQRHERR
jgi:hypothetical protein